jgi:tetratricopeptide (TPR) repeat protein
MTDALVKETISGNVHTFTGRISMKSTQFGVFGNRHRALGAGLRSIYFRFGYADAGPYLLDSPLSPLSRLQYVAVGVAAERQQVAEQAIGKLNRMLLSANDVGDADDGAEADRKQEWKAALTDANAIIPTMTPNAADGENAFALFTSGQYVAAWDKWKGNEKSLREVLGDPIIDVVKGAAAVQRNPADFRARALCLHARHDLLEQQRRKTPELIEAVRSLQLPPMPTPQTSEEKLYAAQADMLQGNDSEADGRLRDLQEDPTVGLQAKLMLAEGMYDRHEYAAALPLYTQAFSAPKAKDIRGFYPYLNYAKLLLIGGESAKAEEFFAKALAHGRFPSHDFSRPAATSTAAGTVYQVYTSGSRSGSIGYSYPEGAAVQWLLTNYDCLARPEQDWVGSAIAARALSDLGLTDLAQALANKTLTLQPEDQYVLATCALVQKRAGDSAGCRATVAHLLKVNPRHPEGLLLAR